MDFSPSGQLVAIGAADCTIRIFSVDGKAQETIFRAGPEGEEGNTLSVTRRNGHGNLNSLSFSRDENRSYQPSLTKVRWVFGHAPPDAENRSGITYHARPPRGIRHRAFS